MSPDSSDIRSGDNARMASEVDAAQDWVILAGFQNGRAAEHMVASLGRGFRQKHRKGHAEALVVTANKDGSLKITQSRALSASGFVYTVMRIGLSVLIGFLGMLEALRGAKGSAKEARHRGGHVGSDDLRAHELFAGIGPGAAFALVTGDDNETRHAVAAQATDQASESWDLSRAEFLAALDPGSKHDWVRAALGEPS
jgi:uncharacterized membrane protein